MNGAENLTARMRLRGFQQNGIVFAPHFGNVLETYQTYKIGYKPASLRDFAQVYSNLIKFIHKKFVNPSA